MLKTLLTRAGTFCLKPKMGFTNDPLNLGVLSLVFISSVAPPSVQVFGLVDPENFSTILTISKMSASHLLLLQANHQFLPGEKAIYEALLRAMHREIL